MATCTYTLLESRHVADRARSDADKPTPVNLTNHGYFNLDGSPDICSHQLMIAGDFITPTRPDLIPTGRDHERSPTRLTISRTPAAGRRGAIAAATTSYDINYVLRGPSASCRHAATLMSLRNGLAMELWTTEPGVQFYDGHMIDIPVPGLGGAHYGRAWRPLPGAATFSRRPQ